MARARHHHPIHSQFKELHRRACASNVSVLFLVVLVVYVFLHNTQQCMQFVLVSVHLLHEWTVSLEFVRLNCITLHLSSVVLLTF